MTGLRRVRQSLKAMRKELDSDRNRPRLVTIEAGHDIDEPTVEAFLDRELGPEREHCLVVQLVRFSEAVPPRIVADQPTGVR